MKKIQDLRENYDRAVLLKKDLKDKPIDQFKLWFAEARSADIREPNAMVLSTINKDGFPNSRVVLLKEIEDDGIIFYTNYNSSKGQAIEQNPNVAAVFLWKTLQRQVRIEGKAIKVSEAQSTRYFQGRPKGSQIGAWVSEQSTEITDRSILEITKADLKEKYKDVDVLPKPPHWGGYKIIINKIEFWQGRPSRLHDRLVYIVENGEWVVRRLAP